ncbi:MAG: serpin family protein [Bacteroidales bacterium]|nr:serpin family protein [Bacteroidales bacterium]MBN2698317.1 serpin family protein [Bacteroidales bacterium]
MKKYFVLFLPVSLLFVSFSCEEAINDPVFDYNKKSATVITTNNDFGLDLFKEIIKNEERPNVMISPASVSIALGMAYNGAETTTKEAFEAVLNYGDLTREEVNEITRELINVLVTNSKGNLLEIANSVWYREGFPVIQNFLDLNSTYFNAEVNELNFDDASAVPTINNWVSEKTHEKIDKILDSIDPETMMILINALYFNCLWETEFDPEDTYSGDFHNEDGSLFGKVDMMTVESKFNYANTADFDAVELPYKNKKFSMYLFLPAGESTVDALIGKLDGDTWNNWLESFGSVEELVVDLPKFEFDYDKSLSQPLKDMGLEIAFTDVADFSGISDVDLLISDVIHKTYIKVNEEGTEAAAVTAVVFDVTSIGPMIRFDRPFLFAITENSSQSILFVGKVMEPA